MVCFRWPALVFALAATLRAAPAETNPESSVSTIVPHETGVLLLPPVDTEPWAANVLAQRQLIVRRRMQYELITRQFKVYSETIAERAARRSPQIDLTNPTARNGANLDELASRTGATWVLSFNVEEVGEDAEDPAHPHDTRFHCHCRVDMKLWDARLRRWRYNGSYIERDARGGSSPVFLFMEAIDEATKGALLTSIGKFPETVTIADVNSVTDYLAGQSEPVAGEPGKPFVPLRPRQP